MQKNFKKIANAPYSPYLFLLGIGIAAYGLHLNKLGFYWDDFPWIWVQHSEGLQGMLRIDKYHRPLSGVVLYFGGAFAGENPALWQVYNFLLRLFSAWALFWALKKLWKGTHAPLWAALLFFLYPGFTQQFVSINASRHIFPLGTFFLSLGFMLKGCEGEAPKRNTSLSLAFSLITMLTTEYYYGLEFIRPLILLLYLHRKEKNLLPATLAALKKWLPYATLTLLVVIWRYIVSMRFNYSITILDDVSQNTRKTLSALFSGAISDLIDAIYGAWAKIFDLSILAEYGGRVQLYSWGIIFGVFIGTLLYLGLLWRQEEGESWRMEALIIGVAASIVAPLPFWIAGLDPKLGFPEDRLLLPSAFGAALLLVLIIDALFRHPAIKLSLLSLLIALSVGSQNQNALEYRTAWSQTTSFFQQLSARAPYIPPGTTILVNQLPGRSTDNSLTAPLNWLYAPDYQSGELLPLQMLFIELRFGRENITLNEERFENVIYMDQPFEGSSEQILLIYHNPPACLQLIAPNRDIQNLPSFIEEIRPYADPALLPAEEGLKATLPAFFADEQNKDWCYYFVKADLARQRQNWEEAARLGDEAFALNKSPNHISERLPFIEAYARVGNWQKAEEITLDASRGYSAFCKLWQSIKDETPASAARESALEKITQELNCDID